MSNNARVVAGGEIGVAQWLQAVAAGVEPDVRMNPVLLKPEADDRSQVVVNGVARRDLTAMPWRDRAEWPVAGDGRRLRRPARRARTRRHRGRRQPGRDQPARPRQQPHRSPMPTHAALLVADIDRGGAFAHLYGTWSLVPDDDAERLGGFVLNKFRGDASLLAPGPSDLTGLTGGVSPGSCRCSITNSPTKKAPRSAPFPGATHRLSLSCAIPTRSNLDELHLLGHVAHVRFATRPADIDGTDMVILPGSKHVAADVSWMRAPGSGRRRATVSGRREACPRGVRRGDDARPMHRRSRWCRRHGAGARAAGARHGDGAGEDHPRRHGALRGGAGALVGS